MAMADARPGQGGGDRPLDRLTTPTPVAGTTWGTTRAAGITAYGEPLRLLEVPVAHPGPGQLTLRLAGAGAGLWDVEEAHGMVALPLPKALGWQGSGVVEQVGDDVEGFAQGDAVLAYVPLAGFYAERVTVPAAMTVRAPTSVPLAEAATLLISASTAYQALVDITDLQPGQTILVTAGAGSTGMHAIELARHLGVHVVTTASAEHHSFLADLGADEVLDYHDSDVVEQIRERHPAGVDVLLDNVSTDNYTAYAALVRPGGTALGTHEPQPAAPEGVTGQLVASWEGPGSFARVVELLDRGVLHLRVRARFDLRDAEAAHQLLRTRHGRGAVLITP